LSAQHLIHIAPHAHNGNQAETVNLNPPNSGLTKKVKLTGRKNPFRLSRLVGLIAHFSAHLSGGFRFKHCSPTGDDHTKRGIKKRSEGFTKEA
jgi:hypothetical protein